jgi:hypothetical protein
MMVEAGSAKNSAGNLAHRALPHRCRNVSKTDFHVNARGVGQHAVEIEDRGVRSRAGLS